MYYLHFQIVSSIYIFMGLFFLNYSGKSYQFFSLLPLYHIPIIFLVLFYFVKSPKYVFSNRMLQRALVVTLCATLPAFYATSPAVSIMYSFYFLFSITAFYWGQKIGEHFKSVGSISTLPTTVVIFCIATYFYHQNSGEFHSDANFLRYIDRNISFFFICSIFFIYRIPNNLSIILLLPLSILFGTRSGLLFVIACFVVSVLANKNRFLNISIGIAALGILIIIIINYWKVLSSIPRIGSTIDLIMAARDANLSDTDSVFPRLAHISYGIQLFMERFPNPSGLGWKNVEMQYQNLKFYDAQYRPHNTILTMLNEFGLFAVPLLYFLWKSLLRHFRFGAAWPVLMLFVLLMTHEIYHNPFIYFIYGVCCGTCLSHTDFGTNLSRGVKIGRT